MRENESYFKIAITSFRMNDKNGYFFVFQKKKDYSSILMKRKHVVGGWKLNLRPVSIISKVVPFCSSLY